MLGREFQRDAFVRLDAENHPVRVHLLHARVAKKRERRLVETDRNFR